MAALQGQHGILPLLQMHGLLGPGKGRGGLEGNGEDQGHTGGNAAQYAAAVIGHGGGRAGFHAVGIVVFAAVHLGIAEA